jgi:uroporphyrin-III C-methyltransferase/precorrin-2 dehydrogenase/sirohydrochlorin ferrochelatase
MSASLFPVFLKLQGRPVLLVGGGSVAAAKLRLLLDAGADVTVVAPEVRREIEASGARIARRGFLPSDLDGVWLAVAAATPDVNRRAREAGDARRVFVNAVDEPDAASAYTGGVLRKGGATIAVSTEGHAPALAGLLREGLEAVIPDQIETWVRAAQALRARQKAEGVPLAERRPALLDALNRLYAAKRGAL